MAEHGLPLGWFDKTGLQLAEAAHAGGQNAHQGVRRSALSSEPLPWPLPGPTHQVSNAGGPPSPTTII